MTSHAAAAAAVRTWGEIQESNLRQAAAACLSLSPAVAAPPASESTTATTGTPAEATPSPVGTAPESTTLADNNNFGTPVDADLEPIDKSQQAEGAEQSAASMQAETARKLDSYLSRLAAYPKAISTIAYEIIDDPLFVPEASQKRDRLEAALLEFVRPLPASAAQSNLTGYQALARIVPEKPRYAKKVEHYAAGLEREILAKEQHKKSLAQQEEERLRLLAQENKQRQKSIIKKLVKKTAEFDGSAWYRHPSSPRYQDIRPFVTLYIRESGSGRRYLELFVNYTSRTDWLFVESAQINVDGKIVRLPPSEWLRDNDTEIWEWTRYVNNAEMIQLARKIAESDRAVIRFNGQQYYSDHVITATEKSVISDMLLAWEGMKD
jgi:hypothetical protein